MAIDNAAVDEWTKRKESMCDPAKHDHHKQLAQRVIPAFSRLLRSEIDPATAAAEVKPAAVSIEPGYIWGQVADAASEFGGDKTVCEKLVAFLNEWASQNHVEILPEFGWVIAEHLLEITGFVPGGVRPGEGPKWDGLAKAFVNAQTFAAVFVMNTQLHSHYEQMIDEAELTLMNALEAAIDSKQRRRAVRLYLCGAVVWISIAGTEIRKLCLHEGWKVREQCADERGLFAGWSEWIWPQQKNDSPRFSTNRWQFWHDRFLALSSLEGLPEELSQQMVSAAQRMEEIEAASV